MPKYSSKAYEIMNVRDGSHEKCHDVTSSRNEPSNSAQKVMLNSLTSEKFIAQYDKLAEFTAVFASTLKISQSLQSRWKSTNHGTIADETGQQAASNFLEIVQNTIHSMQLANVLQISSSSRAKMKNVKPLKSIKNHSATQPKSLRENEECISERTTMVPSDNKEETNNLIINQVDTCNGLRKKSFKDRTEANVTAVTSVSGTENVSKECLNIKEITTSNGVKKIENPQNRGATKIQKKKMIFCDHVPVLEMKKILQNQSLDNIQYVEGNLRVNPNFYKHAYIHMEKGERDLLIIGIANRNRAFDGDLVVACINPEKYWYKFPDGQIQKTGQIVCILEKVHTRKAVGRLKRQDKIIMFHPRDHRIPLVRILPESIPPPYNSQLNFYNDILFLVSIDSWQQKHALGRILSVVGKIGEINAELQRIMLENNLDITPYNKELLKGLPDSDILTDADIKDREDWRHECIFTIDPATAVDIDDAISCKILDNGNYEIGVHVSDVTHYLEFFSPLDIEVCKRATTVYLPHIAHHMLPEQLCQICSLLAGKDRLAFSIIWEMTPDTEIVKHRFAKTVIRSCCQMSYDSAQAMIENPEKSWPENFLDIKENYTVSTLSDIVNKLFKISTQLRDKRFVNGALKLDQPRLQICIDTSLSQEHGIPIPVNYFLQERKDSNSLIEEFMLLANMTVAAQLYTAIPETALLRIHRDPSMFCLNTVRDTLQKYGIHLDIETAGTLQASIHRYDPEYNPVANNNSMKYIMMIIVNLCSKSMVRAEYICASAISSLHDLRHYALNVPLYTHFTSPIRRYSDCIVHRLLYSTMGNKSLPRKWTNKLCSKIAANCNTKKYSAKLAQEQSIELFFAHMVGLAGGFEALATVTYVKDEGIEVILCDTGIKLRIDLKEIEYTATVNYSVDYVPTITINWKKPPIVQVINLFSLVRVRTEKISEELRLKASLLPPPQE